MPFHLENLKDYSEFANIRLIASDIDGTLTRDDQLCAEVIQAIDQLQQYGVSVLLVTGRSAGWGHALAGYLPVAGVIAENGGVFIKAGAFAPPQDLIGLGNWTAHRAHLRACYDVLQGYYPKIAETGDNFSRLTDWTFEVSGLTEKQLEDLSRLCDNEGWGFTYSSVHCHIMDTRQEKGAAIEKVVDFLDHTLRLEEVVTVGDSLNDEAMFNPERFQLSVGVKNIETYLSRMSYKPKYISLHYESAGFLSLAKSIVLARSQV